MPCVRRAAVAHESAQQQERLRRMEAAVREILRGLGEDVQREGLRDTPKRVAKALNDVTAGYALDPVSAIGSALFHEPIVAEGGSGVVLVRDIDFASTSEHTLQPFHGRCHIAYLPADGVVLGLSKLARVTKLFAKRLQSQARLGTDIAAALCKTLGCNDVAVVVQARSLSSPGPDLPQEVVSAALHGCFASSGSTHLLELQELLGIPISDVRGTRPSLPSSSSVLSIGLSCDSESFSVAAPQTPDVSEKDTDGESDDAGMAAEGDTLETMEAAAQQLVAEISGDAERPELQGTARRYIMSLLASTSGYHQKLPGNCQQQQDQGACRQEASADSAMDGVEAEHDARSRSNSCCSASSTIRASTAACEHAGVRFCVQHATMQFRSLCEHHMLPFYGKVHVAYLQPGSGDGVGTAEPAAVVGTQGIGCSQSVLDPAPLLQLGELEQVVGVYTQRLQVQERITHQVADAVAQLLQQQVGASGLGVVVLVDAAHMCMVARGIESHSGSTTSQAVRGEALQAAPELRCTMLREARRAAMRQ